MNDLTIFKNLEFGDIRTVIINNEPWFVGKDVAEALGYVKPENAIATHVDEEDKTSTLIQGSGSNYKSKAICINESGLYALIFGSKLESAQRFKHWVTSEVLPSIRKTGSFSKLSPELQAIFAHDTKIQLMMNNVEDHESRIDNLENTMTVDYGQQKSLNDKHHSVGITAMGGKKSAAYLDPKLKDKVFRMIWRDYKDYFEIASYKDTPSAHFTEAMWYLECWTPDTNLKMEIQQANRGAA